MWVDASNDVGTTEGESLVDERFLASLLPALGAAAPELLSCEASCCHI